jgi:hypothetical protein
MVGVDELERSVMAVRRLPNYIVTAGHCYEASGSRNGQSFRSDQAFELQLDRGGHVNASWTIAAVSS